MSEEPILEIGERKNSRLDFFICLGLVGLVIALFAKTVFLGAPISKIHVIAEWDSIFKNFATGKSQLMDPSQILLMVPYYLLVGRIWHGGELPLWNSESGFGAPLVADPQALALSILHLPLAIHPTILTYNYLLVFELAVMAVGGFILGRSLGLSRVPSVFIGVTLLCCPFEQWYLELLGNGYCLLPLLLAAFLNCARKQTVQSSLIAGVASSIFVLSAHPELSLCSITIASLLLLIMMPPDRVLRGALLLCIAGTIALCLSAPMLLPFVELLINSDSYKFANRAPAYYPWQTLAFNFVQPGFGAASPYLGLLTTLVFPLGVATIYDAWSTLSSKVQIQERDAWALKASAVTAGLAAFAWAISAKIYPLGILLTKRPFSYVVVTYFFPVLLVLVTAFAAFGLERLVSNMARALPEGDRIVPAGRYRHLSHEWLLMLISLVLIVGFPLVAQGGHLNLDVANFDMTLSGMQLANRDFVRNAILAGVVFLIIMVVNRAKLRFTGALVAVLLLLGVNCFSQVALSKGSMPRRPAFAYPHTETIERLQSLPDRRMVFTGEHTMRPNTNLVYSLRDARFHNPIFPKYYIRFLEKAGATLDEFNQVISNKPSKMLDAASVAYIITTDVPLDEPEEIFDDSTRDITGKRFKRIAETSEGMHIYENVDAVPDAYIVNSIRLVDSDDEALNAVSVSSFEPANQLVLQIRPEDRSKFDIEFAAIAKSGMRPAPTGIAGNAIISNRSSLNVSILTESSVPAMLVLTDIWYPGWEASIDGRAVTIARANYSFRAVCLPPGKHTVEFNYRPVPFFFGCGLALAAIIVVLFSTIRERRGKRRLI